MKTNKALLAILVITFLSACQKNEQEAVVPPVKTKNSIEGPSDGGGGDTCNGKMIESYRIDVTDLEEFKEFIQPILIKTTPKKDGNAEGSSSLDISKLKNWYLIDCKLQDIPKQRKGLYFETYQTAIQTSKEIFIDSTSYIKMGKEEKAKLLIHEIMMSYYLIKYLKLSEICKMIQTCTGDVSRLDNWKMFRPEKYRPLNEEDHQKIRNVTAGLWSQRAILSPEKFEKIIKNNDFDNRFEIVPASSAAKEVEVDIQVLLRMFKKYQWAKALPGFCQFDSIKNLSSSNCQTTITTEIRNDKISDSTEIKKLFLKIKIVRDSDKKTYEQEFWYPLNSENQKIKISKNKIGPILGASFFVLLGKWPGQWGVEVKEGLKTQALLFTIDVNNPDSPEIYQIKFETYILYALEDQIVKRDDHNFKETYGYLTLIPEESENLFIENELFFTFDSLFSSKIFIRSVFLP